MERALWDQGQTPFLWEVEVLARKSGFGRIDCLITPVGLGSGERWVSSDKLIFEDDDAWPIDPIEAALAMSDDDVLAVMRPKPSWLD